MRPTEYRTQGWWYTIIGAGLFVGGVLTSFEPGSSKIYIGAILFGPVLCARGIFFLREYYRSRPAPSQLPQDCSQLTAAALYESDIQEGLIPKEVSCETCRHEYVYFPDRAAAAQAAHLGPDVAMLRAHEAARKNRAVAPCPRCGRIQREMFGCARKQAPISLLTYAGIFVTFASALLFYGVMSSVVTPAMAERRDTPNLPLYWLATAAVFLLGVGLLLWSRRRNRRWDPNTQPPEKRLRLARQVSLSRENYVALLPAPARAASADEPVSSFLAARGSFWPSTDAHQAGTPGG
jgi:hypothetical protein